MSFGYFFGKLEMTVGKTMRDGDLEADDAMVQAQHFQAFNS
jgi:hypothetical protein